MDEAVRSVTELVFATQNPNKVTEVQSIAPPWIRILSLRDLDFANALEEDHDTLEANAKQKARFVFECIGRPCFSEDAGLFVECLGGEPGVLSARYAGAGKSSNDNTQLLLRRMEGCDNRAAAFKAVIAFYDGREMRLFNGECMGSISTRVAGFNGFGYDPLFIPDGYRETFGQLDPGIKHRVSHRTKATKAFITFLTREWNGL